jgi:hypothetical protein
MMFPPQLRLLVFPRPVAAASAFDMASVSAAAANLEPP